MPKKKLEKLSLKDVLLDSSSLGSSERYDLKDRASSSIDLLDVFIGGGYYNGRVYQISGEKSSGKSTLLIQLLSCFQQQGGIPIHAESENTLDMDRSKAFGLDRNNIVISGQNISVVEIGFEWIRQQVKKVREAFPDTPLMASWDTIEATVTQSQKDSVKLNKKTGQEEGMDMFAGGRQEKPRIVKFRLVELLEHLDKDKYFLVLLNQVYQRPVRYGDPELVSPGGEGLNHTLCCHLRLSRHRAEIQDSNGYPIGINVRVSIVKNKQGPEKVFFDIPLFFDTGYNNELAVYRYCKEKNLIQVSSNGWVTGNSIFDTPVKAFTNVVVESSRGRILKDTAFYYYMLYLIYVDFANRYLSLRERYTVISGEVKEKIMEKISQGKILNDE